MVETLVSGREAIQRRAWSEAVEAFAEADRGEGLSPKDLELLAEAAWWSGDPDGAVAAMERAFAGHERAGSRSAAAFVALRLGYLAFRRMAVANGKSWLSRAQRLLENEPESVVHAWLKMLFLGEALLIRGDLEEGLAYADQAIELGEKYDSADVRSMALGFKGTILIYRGQWQEGLALVDEASASAGSGQLDPRSASDIYCTTIAACRSVADYRRAREWTEEAERWMSRQSVGGYPGICQVHRAELKRLQGLWPEAEQEARKACVELERFHLMDGIGFAQYEVGEVRLHMGDLVGAEEAFMRAYEHGHDSQPGMALLLLAKGESEEAARSIARVTARGGDEPLAGQAIDVITAAKVLPAQVEIALAAGRIDTARLATRQLEDIANRFEPTAFKAAALSAKGAVLIREDKAVEAIRVLEQAWRRWQEIEFPYESARARMLLGQARAAAGDRSAARLELRTARSIFERLGAALDLEHVNELLQQDGNAAVSERQRLTRTFLFTDIVTSTDLVGLIGDAAWEELLHWHDRALRSAFASHGGEVVRHTGDGFFVTFDGAIKAVECAVDIQRRLSQHRKEHGFAPWVRIGMHTAEATRNGNDYSGQGVHAAARVGGLGDREEIIISAATREQAGEIPFSVSAPRSVTLKGISESFEVYTVDWR